LFHRGLRVAAHQRRYGGRRHGTDPDHMPSVLIGVGSRRRSAS
jgi:hypothetical protein